MVAGVRAGTMHLPLEAFPKLNGVGINNMINEIHDKTVQHYVNMPTGPWEGKTMLHKAGLDSMLKQFKYVQISMMRSEVHIINSIVLPTTVSDDTVYRTRVIEYHGQVPSQVPEEGTGRLMQESEYSIETILKRYMIGFAMSRDYEELKAGMHDVKLKIAHITAGNLMNIAHMGFAALMVQQIADSDLANQLFGEKGHEERILDHKIDFAAAHKSKMGLTRRISSTSALILRDSGALPTYGFLPRKHRALILACEAYTSFKEAGPAGPERVWGTGVPIREIQGVTLVEAPEAPDSRWDSESQLSSYTTIGDYLLMHKYMDQELPIDAAGNVAWNRCGWRSYNQASNQDTWLMLPKMIASTPFLVDEGTTIFIRCRLFELQARVLGVDAGDAPFHDDMGAIDPTLVPGSTSITHPTYGDGLRVKKNDFMDSIYMLGIRWTNTYRMEDGLLVVPGVETGETIVSPGMLTRGEDAGNMTSLVNWAGWAGIHITNPKRFRRMFDFMYGEIISGGNLSVMAHTVDKHDKDLINQVQDLKRVGWGGMGEQTPCMGLMIHPMSQGLPDDQQFLHTAGVPPTIARVSANPTESYPKSKFWSAYFGIQQSANFREVNTQAPRSRIQPAAALFRKGIAYRGVGGNIVEIPGDTHHGMYEMPGCRDVRRTGATQNPRLEQ